MVVHKIAIDMLYGGGRRINTPFGPRILNLKSRRITAEELVGEGAIGILKTLGNYNPQKVAAISPFLARNSVVGMYNAVRDTRGIIKISTEHYSRLKYIFATSLSKEEALNRIAKEIPIGKTKSKHLAATNLYHGLTNEWEDITSFTDEAADRFSEALEDRSEGARPDSEQNELSRRIEEALGKLSERERQVVEMRFGLGSYQKVHMLGEITPQLRVTPERVRQIEVRALGKLRHQFIAKKLREFL